MTQRAEIRALVVPALSGALAPFVLATLFGLYAAHIWSPTIKYLWYSHGVAVATLPVDVAAVIDVILGALLGVATGVGISRLSRGHSSSQWLIFGVFFVLSVTIPTLFDGEYEALVYFLTRPFVLVFLAFLALGLWLARRSQRVTNVA